MTYQHRELASGRWNQMSLVEQLGNIGSEVERALKWKAKDHPDYCMRAFERALELLDLTMASPQNRLRLKEIARTREILVDFFCGENQFETTAKSLSAYFLHFACAARRSAQ
jgi:hypothetical protein